MTQIKLDAKLSANADLALERHAGTLYGRPGIRVVGVCELAHVERTQPAPDEDKEPSVKLRITHLEIANDDQERALRDAMRALYLHRTAQGTLTEDGEVELSERTLAMTEGMLHAIEVARLRAALTHWAEYTRKLTSASLLPTQLAKEIRTVAKGLETAAVGLTGGGDG